MQDDRELLLLVKTTRARLDDATAAIGELHPYEVPEVVTLDAASASAAYGAWLIDAVRRP